MRRLLIIAVLFASLVFIPSAAYGSPHYSQKFSRRQIRVAAQEKHSSRRDLRELYLIARSESTFHNWSHSRSECHGLFQLSKGMAHGKPWSDPLWNSRRAIRYMKGRYGSIHKAYLFKVRNGWY